MQILIIDNGTKHLNRLKKLALSLDKGIKIKIIRHSRLNKIDTSVFYLAILSGGHNFSVLDYPEKYADIFAFIKSFKKPIIGICLGFEQIAFLYGSKLKKMAKKEKD